MFIGLPTADRDAGSRSCRGRPARLFGMIAMKGISLFLLLLGILFIEGFICILMAAPFFYAVGFIVGIFADKARAFRSRSGSSVNRITCVGDDEFGGDAMRVLSFPRNEEITVNRKCGCRRCSP